MSFLERLALVAVAGLLAACSDPVSHPDEVVMRADREAYVIGDTIVIEVANMAEHAIGPPADCRLNFQRREGASWGAETPLPIRTACSLLSVDLYPGETWERRIEVTAELFGPPGEYRIHTTYSFHNGTVELFDVTSNPFTVDRN